MSELQLNNSPVDVDRLSELPQSLLLHILSFLPTKFAIRLSAVSQYYRHLWKASPAIDLDHRDFPPGRAFTDTVTRCFRLRDRSAPLFRFSLKSTCSGKHIPLKSTSNWLSRAYALGLRDLNLRIYPYEFEPLFPLILTFHSLQSLKIVCVEMTFFMPRCWRLKPMIPDNFRATGLRSLHLEAWISCSDLKRLVMEQNNLEDLRLKPSMHFPVDLVSQTVKRAKLTFHILQREHEISLFFPALEALELTMCPHKDMKIFQAMMPLLRKADCIIRVLSEEAVPALSDMLRCFENVSQLSIHIEEAYPREPEPLPCLRRRRSKKYTSPVNVTAMPEALELLVIEKR